MNPILNHLQFVLPQITVLITACAVLKISLFEKNHSNYSFSMALLGLALAAFFGFAYYGTSTELIFSNEMISDDLTQLLTTMIAVAMFFIVVYSQSYLVERQLPVADIYALALFSTLGMMVLIGAHSLLTAYLGLEVMSLPLYALTAVRRTEGDASEAAMKYFITGSMASGFLLFGFSFIYGATGHLNFSDIAHALEQQSLNDHMLIIFGLVFIVAGLAFKFAAVPFHMWAPDVYQGAPLSVTLIIGSAPKFAAIALMIRLLANVLPGALAQWQIMVLSMALLSIIVGNVFAIAQTNIRRMLAYSGISHMGFAFFGICAGNASGYAASVYYILIYVVMTTAAFGLLTLLSSQGHEIEAIDDLKGLNQKNSWAAVLMMIALFSMAGVPPTAGFFIKLAVLKSLVDAGFVIIPIISVFFAVLGAFYYLRVVKVMYFDEPNDLQPVSLGHALSKTCISINGLSLLYWGIFPSGLISMCATLFMS